MFSSGKWFVGSSIQIQKRILFINTIIPCYHDLWRWGVWGPPNNVAYYQRQAVTDFMSYRQGGGGEIRRRHLVNKGMHCIKLLWITSTIWNDGVVLYQFRYGLNGVGVWVFNIIHCNCNSSGSAWVLYFQTNSHIYRSTVINSKYQCNLCVEYGMCLCVSVCVYLWVEE